MNLTAPDMWLIGGQHRFQQRGPGRFVQVRPAPTQDAKFGNKTCELIRRKSAGEVQRVHSHLPPTAVSKYALDPV